MTKRSLIQSGSQWPLHIGRDYGDRGTSLDINSNTLDLKRQKTVVIRSL